MRAQLFNGKDVNGWQHCGAGQFIIEKGLLKTQGGMGLLWYTERIIGNTVVRVVYKTTNKKSNSGVFIRIPQRPTEPWMAVNKGYEVQIDDSGDDYHTTGTLYSFTKAMNRFSKPNEWNTLEITIDGATTHVTVNGAKVTEFTEGDDVPARKNPSEPERGKRPNEGYIGLQNHSDNDVVYFKEISIRPIERKQAATSDEKK